VHPTRTCGKRLTPSEPVPLRESGRYRVLFSATDRDGEPVAVDPTEFWFDIHGCRRRKLQFQGTYDWPDNFGNVVYSPRDLEREMQWYKDCGLDRIYWLDYAAERWLYKSQPRLPGWTDRIQECYRLFGGDFLPGAVRAAHKVGQGFVTIFKPFDFTPEDAFVSTHPELCVRRNPAWTSAAGQQPIQRIQLFQNDDQPFPFAGDTLQIWQSKDNVRYRRVRAGVSIAETIVDRPLSVSSPLGSVPGSVTRRVRCLTVTGLKTAAPYLALVAPECDPCVRLQNRAHALVELHDLSDRAVSCLLDVRGRMPDNGFDFGPRKTNEASWTRSDVGVDRILVHRGESLAIGISRVQQMRLPGFLEPCFPEVRKFWLDQLRRGIDAGADGISIRIAHHVGCVDWLSYMYAEPVLEEFRRRTGREPEPVNEDYTLIRRIRGEAYTQLVRDASTMARRAGRRFQHHIENRMLVPVEYDCYSQIHWDWQTWIRERLVDEVDLKYIGADHSACWSEILPLARKHGVKVNWISADPEPRSRPRSVDESPWLIDRAAAVGLDGINLYELWLYRRMTDRGYPMTRGSGEAIIRHMRKRIDELTRS